MALTANIHYSQCWEDPAILERALQVNSSDQILSITSGGCNTLTLLLGNPASIVAVDSNPSQNYLLELKIAAIKKLDHPEFLEFLGIHASNDRVNCFKDISDLLTENARVWWEARLALIREGIIHIGKFENYLKVFRKHILPFIHSTDTVEKFLALPDATSQRIFYRQTWDCWRWRFFFGCFLIRFS